MRTFIITLGVLIIGLFVKNVVAAATFDEAELAKLRQFLIQESGERGVKNFEKLGLASMDDVYWASLPGVRWNGITSLLEWVSWPGYNLSGYLDLSDFAGLKYLNCANNDLKSVNLRNASALIRADFYINDLRTIDVTTNPLLEYLRIGYNHISYIDLSHNPNLNFFCCTDNQFESLHISDNNRIQTFYCVGNKLYALEIANCPNLETIACDFNNLTSLHLSDLPSLKSLSCILNEINEIRFSNCPSLESIICNNNALTALDISFQKHLTTLNCNTNRITTLNLEGCESLTTLSCDNNLIDRLDITSSPLVSSISCKYNNLSFLTLPLPTPQLKSYSYTPQNYVAFASKYDSVDFSEIYNIEDNISRYSWYYLNVLIAPAESNEGLFAFDESHIGKTFVCRVQNRILPLLVMHYDVTFTQGSDVGNRNPDNDGLSVYASDGTIHIVTGSSARVGIYSLQGVLLTERMVGAGHAGIPAERGAYVVIVNNTNRYKLIVR